MCLIGFFIISFLYTHNIKYSMYKYLIYICFRSIINYLLIHSIASAMKALKLNECRKSKNKLLSLLFERKLKITIILNDRVSATKRNGSFFYKKIFFL